MSLNAWLPALIVLSSLIPGLAIFFLREESNRTRSALNLAGALLKLALVLWLLAGTRAGAVFEARFSILPGVDLLLHADPMSLLFVTLSSLLWLLTTIYAIGYLERSPRRSRFFAFFSLCVTATAGVARSRIARQSTSDGSVPKVRPAPSPRRLAQKPSATAAGA